MLCNRRSRALDPYHWHFREVRVRTSEHEANIIQLFLYFTGRSAALEPDKPKKGVPNHFPQI